MLCQCSFKISRVRQTSILELWPFDFSDLSRLLSAHPPHGGGFLAVEHPHWREGFHPPSIGLLSGAVTRKGSVANLRSKTLLFDFLRSSEIDSVVDLKLFFPHKPIVKETEIALLERSFEDFNDGAALNAWGGYWIHVHDACKTYITLPLRSGPLNAFFAGILQASGARLERKEISILCRKLHSLPDSQCLILAWHRHSVRCRIKNADVHNNEQMDELIS